MLLFQDCAPEGIHPPGQAAKKSQDVLASPGGCSLKPGGCQLSIRCQVLSSIAASAADSAVRAEGSMDVAQRSLMSRVPVECLKTISFVLSAS